MPPVDPRRTCRASTAITSPRVARLAQPDLRGPCADRADARLARFRAPTPGGAEGVRRRDDYRPAARERGRGRLHPRGSDRGAGRLNAKFGLTAGDIMFDDLSLYPRSTRSSARSGSHGGTSAATTTSISRRPAADTAARPTSGSSGRTITRSSMPDAVPHARRRRLSRA